MTTEQGCPTCGSPPDEMCTTPAGKVRNDHAARRGARNPKTLDLTTLAGAAQIAHAALDPAGYWEERCARAEGELENCQITIRYQSDEVQEAEDAAVAMKAERDRLARQVKAVQADAWEEGAGDMARWALFAKPGMPKNPYRAALAEGPEQCDCGVCPACVSGLQSIHNA